MKQTLSTFPIYNVTGMGSAPKLRLVADQDFVANTGEVVLQGDEQTNYREITPAVAGTTLTAPNISNIDTNDDSSQPNGTYTLYLVDSNGRNPRVIFERWRFSASMGSVVTIEDLEVYNNNKVPLRDADTYSKNQVNSLIQSSVNVGNPATTTSLGRVKMSVAPADAASPIAVGDNDPRLAGPTGPAGGVLGGTYPNPTFAVNMATQEELDAVAATIPTIGVTQSAIADLLSSATLTDVINKINAVLGAARGYGVIAQTPFTEIVYASFFGSDSASALPNAETGHVWTQVSGVWGIRRFMAYVQTTVGTPIAVVNPGISDCNIRLRVRNSAGLQAQGIIFRYTDASNYLMLYCHSTVFEIYKTVAGAQTKIGEWVGGGISADDLIEIVLSGNNILAKKNEQVRIASFSDAFNASATRHGMMQTSSLDASSFPTHLDDFSIDTENRSTTSYINFSSLRDYQILQRNDLNKANISRTGTYSGNPTTIEMRFNNGAWEVVDTIPSGGTFSGSLISQTAGQGMLEVRFSNDLTVVTRQRHVGIGDVFLLIGQSNIEGQFSTPSFYSHASKRAGLYGLGGKWREAHDPTDEGGLVEFSTAKYSMWPAFITSIMAATGYPVGLITAAAGATGLIADGGLWAKPNASYTQAITTVQNSGVNALRAVIYGYGEQDANNPSMTQAAYETAIKALQDNLQADLGYSIKLVVCGLGYLDTTTSTETRASVDAVRLAQINACDTDTDLIMGPQTYDLDISTASGGDGVHFTSSGHRTTLATRMARVIKHAFFGGGEGRGPRVSTVTRIDNATIDIVFTLSSSLVLQTSPAIPTTGWRVANGATVGSVISATRVSGTTVRLTIGGLTVTAGTTVLSWASYNDAVGQTFQDNGTTPMPVEPFTRTVA